MHQSDYHSFNDISQYEVSTQVALHTSYCKDKSPLSVSKGVTVTKADIAVCNNLRKNFFSKARIGGKSL